MKKRAIICFTACAFGFEAAARAQEGADQREPAGTAPVGAEIAAGQSSANPQPRPTGSEGEAGAQEANANRPNQAGTIGDIVVTAQRRAERLQDTPVSVSAFNQDLIDQRQIQRTQDIAESVPSLYINTVSASPSSLTVFLRGAGEQVGGLATSESPVGIYIDDVYFARLANANFDLPDVERIEVLRGPQGTLYGRNTMTGALKIITHRPTDELWTRAQASYGRFDEVRLSGVVSGPLAGGLGASLSGYFNDRDGWFRNLGPDPKRGDRRTWGGRASLATIDNGTVSARISAFYGRDRNDGITPVPVNPNPPYQSLTGGFRTTRSPVPAYGNNRQAGAIGEVSVDLGGATVKSITGYIGTRDRWALDFSGGFRNAAGTVVAGFLRQSETDHHQFSQELQVQGTGFGDRLNWLAGLFYFTETAEQTLADSFGTGVFGPFPVALLPTQFEVGTKSYAAFGQADYALTDQLTLTLGLRYTRDKKRFSGRVQNGFAFPFAYAPANQRRSWDDVLPKIGLDYKPNPDVLLYANISKGFRAGGFNGLAVANPAVFGAPYDPETVWAYEAGVKSDLLDRRLRLNVAYFYNDLRNLQQNVVVGGGSTRTENAARASLQGIEVESSAKITAALSIFGNLSLLWDDYKRLSPTSQAAIFGAERLATVSRLQSQLGFALRQPLGNAAGNFLANADWSHRSSRFSESANLPVGRIGPVDRVNAQIGYETEGGRWQFTLSARNLLGDRDYYSGLSLIPGVIAVKFFEEPMTWMASVRYRLDWRRRR
jgi:iron complex outermembrane receptor protein